MTLTSTAFSKNNEIPVKFTCEGDDVSPTLEYKNVPTNAKSLVLIVDDPDAPDPQAPKMVWIHWILYNLPPKDTRIPENVNNFPKGTLEGLNSWKRTKYGGPCPPIGRHRYFFKLYALDTVLPDLHQPTKNELLQAMRGHIIDEAVLMGTYMKKF